jgi:hypothetical protein
MATKSFKVFSFMPDISDWWNLKWKFSDWSR